jgi:F-type H+-transporting ATPase subunit a
MRAFPPILPHIQLPPEALSEHPLFTLPVIGDFYLTNTIVAVLIADVILLVMALMVRRAIGSGKLVLSGIPGAVEAALEAMYELTETTAGRWAKSIFPWFAAITLLVLVVNWMELIPGVDSIGFLHHSEEGHPVQTVQLFGAELEGVQTIIPEEAGEPAEAVGTGEHAEELYSVVPWIRVTSTDLNFTLGLALVSVFVTQIFGVRALGGSYFTKFFNVKTLFSKPMFGAIDFGVSLLELVSEVSKILSFSFRLFGNIFAGTVLLFVIGTLIPVFAQTIFLMLEFFVGLIQALVFGLLTMIFMAQATVGHGPGEEGHH